SRNASMRSSASPPEAANETRGTAPAADAGFATELSSLERNVAVENGFRGILRLVEGQLQRRHSISGSHDGNAYDRPGNLLCCTTVSGYIHAKRDRAARDSTNSRPKG